VFQEWINKTRKPFIFNSRMDEAWSLKHALAIPLPIERTRVLAEYDLLLAP